MCDNRVILIFLLISKILFIVLIPIIIYTLFKNKDDLKNSLYKRLIIVELLLLFIFIIVFAFFPKCFSNSKIKKIFNNQTKKITTTIKTDLNITKINPEILNTSTGKKVYYYNNNKLPLNYIKIDFCNKDIYYKHFGNSVSTISSMISTSLDKTVDPIELMKKTTSNNMFSCDTGVDVNNLMSLSKKEYGVNFQLIYNSDIIKNVKDGNIVLAEINYSDSVDNNITCDIGYILIYDIDEKGNLLYLDTNRKNASVNYICPESTKGEYTIINTKKKDIKLEDIKKIGKRFFVAKRGE